MQDNVFTGQRLPFGLVSHSSDGGAGFRWDRTARQLGLPMGQARGEQSRELFWGDGSAFLNIDKLGRQTACWSYNATS